jgi:hypothetical protein
MRQSTAEGAEAPANNHLVQGALGASRRAGRFEARWAVQGALGASRRAGRR